MALTFKTNEVDLSIEIMKEVASWGRKKGLRVWEDHWLTRSALVTSEADEESFCVGYHGMTPVCTMILQWQDDHWWPGAQRGEAAYIHKLCVRRDFSGQNIPLACLDYVLERCRERGASYVRLDTGWDEIEMKKLYRGLGFEIIEKVETSKGKAMALFEYKL